MTGCAHQWQKMHEQSLVGGTFATGYRCKLCNEFTPLNVITPAGLPGTDTGENVLYGPHGGRVTRSDGSNCKEQIVYPDGRLEIIR